MYRMLKYPVTLVAVLTVLSLLLIFFFQDSLIFQSEKLDADYVFTFDTPFQELFIKTKDGETLNALLFSPPDSAKGLILYFHGNAGNLKRWGGIASGLTAYGYQVLAVDYRGYGKSTGVPDEPGLYQDAEAVWQWALTNLPFTRLVIYGRSLGSAVASHLAIQASPRLLVLETPFDRLHGAVNPVFRPLLSVLPLKYDFPTRHHLSKTNCKKLVFHGTADQVVALSSAIKLKSVLRPEDEFIILQEGTHDNLGNFNEYKQKLADALK